MTPFEFQVETVVQKVKHYLISTIGRSFLQASDEDILLAFSQALREEIMINWTATNELLMQPNQKRLYYFSMEYMPGRRLTNNVINIGAYDLMKAVLKKLGRDYRQISDLEPDMGIGNGGLGRLASCLLDSLATKRYPALGYGLRYEYGIFEQELWMGMQIERPDRWLIHQNPWEIRKDSHARSVRFGSTLIHRINSHGDEVYELGDGEEVRALPYDYPIIGYKEDPNFAVVTLRLWSTKQSPRNFELQRFNAGQLDQATENTLLTDVLYPNDNNEVGKRIRLKQEFLLVSASLQDILCQYKEVNHTIANFADLVSIQINDTHPALIIPELIRLLITEEELRWDEAVEITAQCCGYTNHTVMREALEEWNVERVRALLPAQTRIIERLNYEYLQNIRKRFPQNEPLVQKVSVFEQNQMKMAHLAYIGCHKINGVSKVHTEILHSLFKDFPESDKKIIPITNGVSQRRWLLSANPLLASFITKRIGSGWITRFEEIEKLRPFAKDPESQQEFSLIKSGSKKQLLGLIHSQEKGRETSIEGLLSIDALFDVQIKRFHEYKRQLMNALYIIIQMHRYIDDPKSCIQRRLVIFSGKAAPGYWMAKNIIRLIYCLARRINKDPLLKDKLQVIFIENYTVSKAEIIIPAADLSEQISTAGYEASGTGNMKFALNGALTIATADGATIEMSRAIGEDYWPFGFGASHSEISKLNASFSYDPGTILSSHREIARAVNALADKSLTENDAEHESLLAIYQSLTEWHPRDRYFCLHDLVPYIQTQRSVDLFYQNRSAWNECALHTISSMGYFSSDRVIEEYARNVWGIKPLPAGKEVFTKVREEFSEHDRCKILI